MDIFKRIGTQKKKFKLQFFIGRLKFSAFFPGKVYIVLRRGGHKVKSEQKIQMPEDCKLNFNKEILQLQVTLYFDQKENKYQQKPGQMDIVMIDSKGDKILLGIVPIDVGYYANMAQESMKQKKQIEQTPKGFQGLIEFNIFIKYIGQGSQSSLDKVADFFFGKSKQPESQKKLGSKNETNSNSKIQDPTKKGSLKELPKTQAKKGTNVDFYQLEGPVANQPKNYVTTAKGREGSRQFVDDNEEVGKNFYFDEPQIDVKKEKKNKKSKKTSNSLEKKKENKGKGDSQKLINDRGSDKKESAQQKSGSKKQITYPILTHYSKQQTIAELKAELEKVQKDYAFAQAQLSDQYHINGVIRINNEKLQQELASCKEQLRQKNQQLEQEKAFSRQSEPPKDIDTKEKLDLMQKEIKKIQKEKAQLLVETSKLKEKHKNQIKKYEQLLDQRQSNQQTKTDSVKADLIKLRQECSQYRETIQKLTKQKNDKHQELIKQKTQNKTMQEQLTEVKTNLSKIKLKICNKLNEYFGKDNDLPIVDILMDLNKDD